MLGASRTESSRVGGVPPAGDLSAARPVHTMVAVDCAGVEEGDYWMGRGWCVKPMVVVVWSQLGVEPRQSQSWHILMYSGGYKGLGTWALTIL